MAQLTKEQIANWRNVLTVTLGPYALLMPDEEIIAYHAMMQAAFQQRRAVDRDPECYLCQLDQTHLEHVRGG